MQTNTSIEIWKPVRGWNSKYYISDNGRLKSINGKYSKRHPEGFITQGAIDTTGYRCVTLRSPGKKLRIRIHTLVGDHFLFKPSWAECINHKDGNKLNNHWSNLEWTTMASNVKHAVKIGLMDLKGEKHPHVKLTIEQVIEMRLLRKNGLTYQQISDQFPVTRRQASDVIRGVNWGWLKEGL